MSLVTLTQLIALACVIVAMTAAVMNFRRKRDRIKRERAAVVRHDNVYSVILHLKAPMWVEFEHHLGDPPKNDEESKATARSMPIPAQDVCITADVPAKEPMWAERKFAAVEKYPCTLVPPCAIGGLGNLASEVAGDIARANQRSLEVRRMVFIHVRSLEDVCLAP